MGRIRPLPPGIWLRWGWLAPSEDKGRAASAAGSGGQAWPDDRRKVDFPQAPQGLQVSGGFSAVLLEWLAPTYGGHALTEIYRHTQDNLADAVLVATSASVIYGDPVDPGWQGFYWIRFVNTAGVPGPFNAPEGTAAQTHPEVDAVISLIGREINDSPLIAELVSGQEEGQQALSETRDNLRSLDREEARHFSRCGARKTASETSAQASELLRAATHRATP